MGSNSENRIQIAGALTYPSGSSNMEPASTQPRQPRSLQGLLRFAMEATKAEDAPGHSNLGPMDEQRRIFLEQALNSLTLNQTKVLQSAIEVLTDAEKMRSIRSGEPLPNEVLEAFDKLLIIDDMDLAKDFSVMGGFATFPICYSSENEKLRAEASSLLAELCQNNPFCQARALECGLLNVLLHLVRSERGHAQAKCLLAISCITREYEPACRSLIVQDGCPLLATLLAVEDCSVRTKAAFLIRSLVTNSPEAKQQFIEANIVKTITEQMRAGRNQSTEHLLSVLQALVEDLDARVLQQCRDPDINLKKFLIEHLKHPDLETDQFVEEREYCEELLKQIFGLEICEEVADR